MHTALLTSGPLDVKLDGMAGLGKVGPMVQHKHRLVTVRIGHFGLEKKKNLSYR
jgi:hypothetical protein